MRQVFCGCGHSANAHFGSYVIQDGQINFNDPFTNIKNCGEGHDFLDLSMKGCRCSKFKVDNLKFLEKKYKESLK